MRRRVAETVMSLPARVSKMNNHSSASTSHGLTTIHSAHSFAETVARLRSALPTHPIKIFITIDQQAEAAAVGLTMPPTVLIIFGNPQAGTPLMVARPLSAIDLPLKVLISEPTPGEVLVTFNTAQYLADRHGVPHDLVAKLAPADRLIANALGG